MGRTSNFSGKVTPWGTGMELGAVCGKPFIISVLTVIEEGNSDILKAKS